MHAYIEIDVLELINKKFLHDVLTTTLVYKSATNILLLSFHHISKWNGNFLVVIVVSIPKNNVIAFVW
jgi:hypothetical protein